MKRFFIIFFLIFIFKTAYSQNYYYYKGNRITLEQRTDKAVVVLNSNLISKEQKTERLSDLLSSDIETKEISDNVYLLNFNGNRTASEIQFLISSLPFRNSLIKLVSPAYFGESNRVTQLPTDEFIVKIKNAKDIEKLDIINAENNVSIIGKVSNERGYLLRSNDNVRKNALELSDIYFKTGLFEYAEPNFMYPEGCLQTSTPNDPLYPLQWALNNTGQLVPTGDSTHGDKYNVNGIPDADIDADLAWDFTMGSPSIRIGIIDSGIDSTHPDLRGSNHLLTGYDAVYNKYGVPRDSGDFGGHGTATAGLAGALTNNGTGVAGVAPGCKLMAFRIFNLAYTATSIGIGRAFDTAVVLGIEVLSNSWNGGTPSSTVTDAINNAALTGRGGLGAVILFTAGNEGKNQVWFPSYLNNVVCVGASTTHDQKKAPGTGNQFWWGANYGENENGDLDMVAPTDCYTTDIQGVFGYNNTPGINGNYFKSFNGTSCACPQVSGIAALVLSVNPVLTRIEVMEILYRGCEKIDNIDYSTTKTYGKWNEYCGYGKANALHSVRLAAGVDVTPPSIVHSNVPSHSSTYPTPVIAEIIDQDGSAVPSTGIHQPRLFFRINQNDSGWSEFESVYASITAGNIYTFYIPCQGYETQIEYYIVSFDNLGNAAYFPKGAPDDFWLCHFAIGNLELETHKIGEFVSLERGISYSPPASLGDFTILNTRVQLFLKHPNLQEEVILLYSPLTNSSNNRKCLFTSNGGNGADIDGATVTDSATQFWTSGLPPFSNGLYKGDYLLNGLNGENASGDWRILNYDRFIGNAAAYDSVILSFTKTNGVPSSSARHNFPSDTVLNFGTVNYPDSVVKNFYITNVGTDSLRVNGIFFTGTYSYKFSILNLPPVSIPPDDSALFFVLLRTHVYDSTAAKITGDEFENAVLNFNTDDPSKPVFRVSLQTDNIIPEIKNLNLKIFIQGFYDTLTNSTIRDTVFVFLRDTLSPYSIIDSSKACIDSTGSGSFIFLNASNEINYFIQVAHRNSIRTWNSLPGQRFVSNIMNFDMTADTIQVLGYNLVQVDNDPIAFAIFNGDVNLDGTIDGSDMLLVDNDAVFLIKGYVPTDVNGDGFVDGTDALITSNNAAEFIVEISP